MSNGFGINEEEFDRIKKDTAYFKGLVVSEIRTIKESVNKQEKTDNEIKKRLGGLPCYKNNVRIKFAFFLIVILFMLLGYVKFPLILKFFGLS